MKKVKIFLNKVYYAKLLRSWYLILKRKFDQSYCYGRVSMVTKKPHFFGIFFDTLWSLKVN